MNNYLLYTKATSTTGRNLLEALQEQGVDIYGGSLGPGNKKINTLIRWGATKNVGKWDKVYNEARAISLASNKLESLRVLRKAGVRVPKIYPSLNDVKAEDFPVFGREIHHIAGNDIVMCLQKKDLIAAQRSGCTYFTQYIPSRVEYRFHIFGELSIKASQKILTEPERNKDPWIKNWDEGYTFHAPTGKVKEARELAKKAVKALDLNFGAVDVIVGEDGKPYVLEINTAPGLQTDSSIEVYVTKFKEVLS